MRASGPYEVKPRQLRALVLLLALLPLIPMTFVVRFVVDDIANQRLEARERTKPVYQKFLDATSLALATAASRQIPGEGTLDLYDPWRPLHEFPGMADTVFIASPDGRLSPPAVRAPDLGRAYGGAADALARAIWEAGMHYAVLPRTGPVRWRFMGDAPDPYFGLHPRPPVESAGVPRPTLLFVKKRQHLLEQIAAYYQHALDPQTALRLMDESGESIPLVGPADAGAASGGEPLGETTLRPPLPAWRVQLYSVDAALVDGIARVQISFYWWSVTAMIAVTAGVAGVAGWALTRRISLHELSNDALAVVSHEMKTPLASTRLLIETLLERRYRGGADQADEYLRLIAGENLRLEQMIEGFQMLSRLEHPLAGRPRLTLEAVRAQEIADAARLRLGPRLQENGCDFQSEIDPQAPPFPADRNALVAVVTNLLDNALKYSERDPYVRLRAHRQNGYMVFEVADHGVGIDPAEQSRIFERFYQADRRLSRTHEGCGLGLSIVRSVVHAHGGSVSVHSTLGKGSTFTVRIPVGEGNGP